MVKSLRLSWIGRLLDGTNSNWKGIPAYFFNKYGGLNFLLKCNYDVTLFKANFPLFYCELLGYFQELSSAYGGDPRRKFILWNNKDISIDQKTLFWKTWFERGIYCVQDLLKEDLKFLCLTNSMENLGWKLITCSTSKLPLPYQVRWSKLLTPVCSESLFSTPELFFLSEETTLSLSKMPCKHYYKLCNECSVSKPTGIKK